MKVVIVGGGISGLAAAHALLRNTPHVDLTICEAGSRFGGVISTLRTNGCIIEEGPDSFLTTKPWALQLCRELHLDEKILPTNEENRRAYVARAGKLQPLPDGFFLLAPTKLYPFFDSPILSFTGKLAAACEPFREANNSDDGDETLRDFVIRRFGPELFDRIAQPMVGGIYTGDPAKLSARATVPQFVEMERKHGSVVKAMLLKEEQPRLTDSGARYSAFVTLENGLESLVDRLVETITERIGADRMILNCKVDQLTVSSGRVKIETNSDRTFEADRCILACPARALSQIVRSFDSDIAKSLSQINYSSSVVLNMLFNAEDLGQSISGFGFVVPELEEKQILACSFSSYKFSGRVPEGMVLVRVFMGGALHPEILALSDGELTKAALSDLRSYLQLCNFPQKVWIKRWNNSMPQYHVGHLKLLADLNMYFSRHEQLVWAQSGLAGVGIPDCVHAGFSAANKIAGGRAVTILSKAE